MKALRYGLAVVALASCALAEEQARITVDAQHPGHAISPMLYGIFFEEINHAGDGGLYAEMLQNRSFEDSWDRPEGWQVVGLIKAALDRETPLNEKNRTSLRLEFAGGEGGVMNMGFGYRPNRDRDRWPDQLAQGLALRQGETYNLSFYARASGMDRALVARLVGRDGKELARATLATPGAQWTKLEASLKASATDLAGRLEITSGGAGTLWLDQVSLMPADTWKGLPLRRDLGEMIAAMKPAFVRFPGGCYVEGYNLGAAERWKDTVGDPAQRPGHPAFWGYRSTGGLGFHEFLLWCEALNAEPVYVINCGMTHGGDVPMEKMSEWVQDAVDLVEYARGPADSKWGSLRARMGHPTPFRFHYVEVGNENGGNAYRERYALFHDALKAKYPDLHLIADDWAGGYPKNRPVELADQHIYADPNTIARESHRYDKHDRGGVRIYMGEYAVTQKNGRGAMIGAAAEAAFMTGLERNSDVVMMSSYAPLLANVTQIAWTPDAIYFDNARAYGTPSYYVQTLFAGYRGDVVLPTECSVLNPAAPTLQGGVGVGTYSTAAEFKDLRVTRGDQVLAEHLESTLTGWKLEHKDAWSVADGALRQARPVQGMVLAHAGEGNWSDYTYTLKARKISGDEGFIIPFAVSESGRGWWNLGGWGNKQTALDFGDGAVNPVPMSIETGRWYDIRIELQQDHIRCYLDGTLIHDVRRPVAETLFATASREEASGQIILKIANLSDQVRAADIAIDGLTNIGAGGTITTLAGPRDAENTLEQPMRIAPRTKPLPAAAGAIHYAVPPTSVTVLRVPTR